MRHILSLRRFAGIAILLVAPASTALAQQDWAARLASPDPNVRRDVIGDIAETGNPAHAPLLLPLLKDPHPYVRMNVIWGLEDLSQGRYAGKVLPLLNDPVSGVRSVAAGMLGTWGEKRAIPDLGTLLSDAEPSTRSRAAEALGALGAQDQIPRLLLLLQDPSADVLRSAIRALQDLNAGDAVQPLLATVPNSSPWVGQYAVQAAGTLGQPSDLPALLPLLDSPEWQIRENAILAVGRIAARSDDSAVRQSVIDHLTTLSQIQNSGTRACAVIALTRLGAASQQQIQSTLNWVTIEDDGNPSHLWDEFLDAFHDRDEKTSYAKYTAPRTTLQALKTVEDLKTFFRDAGLELALVSDAHFFQWIGPGVRLSPQQALARMIDYTSGTVIEGAKVTVHYDVDDAVKHWRRRLGLSITGLLNSLSNN